MKKLMTTFSYVRNKHGIPVKVICASCDKKRCIDSLRFRKCVLAGKKTRPGYCCPKWRMSQGMGNAGEAGGVVRDIHSKEVILK